MVGVQVSTPRLLESRVVRVKEYAAVMGGFLKFVMVMMRTCPAVISLEVIVLTSNVPLDET